MPPFKIETSELEVRSVLMRLYHSYWESEEFYPARFVNGCAPSMEAKGWIEKHGDGWRITEDGIDQWAEMNRHALMLNSKQRSYLSGSQYFFLRDRLPMEGRSDMAICKKEGCDKPRHIGISGNEFTYCHEHQKEQWAATKRQQNAEKKEEKPSRKRATPKPVKSVGLFNDGDPTPTPDPLPMDEQPSMVYFFGTPTEVVEGLKPAVQALMSSSQQETAVEPVNHDCESCYAKGVIEALKAKSPKLAKLIDAMEAQERAAFELGL